MFPSSEVLVQGTEQFRRNLALGRTRRVLGIDATADRKHIITAFRQKAKQVHPDQGGSAESFRNLKLGVEGLLLEHRNVRWNRGLWLGSKLFSELSKREQNRATYRLARRLVQGYVMAPEQMPSVWSEKAPGKKDRALICYDHRLYLARRPAARDPKIVRSLSRYYAVQVENLGSLEHTQDAIETFLLTLDLGLYRASEGDAGMKVPLTEAEKAFKATWRELQRLSFENLVLCLRGKLWSKTKVQRFRLSTLLDAPAWRDQEEAKETLRQKESRNRRLDIPQHVLLWQLREGVPPWAWYEEVMFLFGKIQRACSSVG